jgi:hypothetical protein
LDLFETFGPFVNHPVVPIQGKTVHRYDINRIKHAQIAHPSNEKSIDRRNAAQHTYQPRVSPLHSLRGSTDHGRKLFPFRIDLEIPMRLVIRLIPKHHCFDHR